LTSGSSQPWSVPCPRRVLYDGRLPCELSMLVVEALWATALSDAFSGKDEKIPDVQAVSLLISKYS